MWAYIAAVAGRNPEVDAFLASAGHPRTAEIERLRSAILEADPGISETVKWRVPNFRYDGVDRVTFRLQPGDVVVLDNLPVHKVAGLEEVAQKYGARLLYLPPYSPDFNPIELAFSKLKTWLRTVQARTRDALEDAIRAAAQWITVTDAENRFDHCGYHVH